ncbi:hypothetical protein SLEP1_g10077 [Rubroshorea leprosula]|uniref:Integrase catalytic domain-containing protein n=1 Tax=Rubroshorea leprosula TaxID=152421 RepID=A0AAV5IBI2_9ROSI|nr:hypothetical protein SLEP1_g10077 [Rubroshorea leprosula]
MASETFVQPAIPRFDGHYDHWSMLMENFLRSKEHWNVVESGVAEPTVGMSEAQKVELEALKLKDLKAKNYLFQAIDRTILETILCKDTSKQIWDSMKKKYQGTTKTKRQQLQALRSEFEILRMKEGETVTDYFSRTMAIVNKLRTHGDKTQDVIVVEKILRSMTPKYNFVVCAIEEANDLDEMSLDELESSLLIHERTLNRQDKEELALKVSTDHYSSTPHKANRGRGRGNMDQRSHQTQSYDSQGRGRGRGKFHSATYKPKSADKSTVECYRCHSNHMCGDKSVFSILDESFRDTMKFGDNSKISVMGKGQVNIRTRDCATQTISNVLYVPELKTNLLSIGQLQERGYEIVIKNGVCRIHDNNLGLIAQAAMTPNKMFPLHLKTPGLKTLQQRTMVTGLPEFNSPSEHKSEAFVAFKSYKVLVEKEAGSPIKVFRTDCGGEYCSDEFAKFCDNKGIKRQITAAYTPQQNGVCETKNRTILDMVRSLLARSCIPKYFWPEAVNWSIHILNRSPTLAVKDMTPEEAWSGRKPTVDHLRIFGCVTYAHVPDQKRKKLDNKGEKCIFLSVGNQSKAYKLYNPSTKKTVISRDVVFDEEQIWPRSKNGTTKCISADFDGGDDEEKQQSIENVQQQLDMDEQQPASTSNAPEDAQSPAAAKEDEQRSQRVKKRPAWMTDYEVYKTKLKDNGEIDKFKARLVAKGYKQEFGIDYKEVYAPIARHDTIRLVFALAAQNSWPLYQLDVKSAFLHGDLDEEVFIHQPPGYVKAGNEHKVYKLKRALYGLKQAPRAWYSRIESHFLKEGFKKCPYEHTLFIKSEDGKMLIVCLYIYDLNYTGNDMVMFDKFKKSMMVEFEMSDLGLMHYYLGIEVNQSAAGIFISHKKYVQDILDKFRMKNCNPVNTPIEPGLKLVKNLGGKEINSTLYKQIVGSLMYLTATRPDIMHAVSLISRYMDCPKEVHLLAAKRILKYLQGTAEYGLFYKNGEKSELFGFTGSDFARDLDDRKSTSGYVFIMGIAAISWTSRKQSIVTLSTTEAEFVAATTCACQAIWLRKVLEELQVKQEGPMLIFCDNSSTIKLSKNPVLHGRCKHMDVKFHFLRDLTNEGVIDLVYCRTEDQIADIFTKPLKLSAFRRQRELLGVCIFYNN